jgi:hypothetical protein
MDYRWNAQPATYSIGDMRGGGRDVAGDWYGCYTVDAIEIDAIQQYNNAPKSSRQAGQRSGLSTLGIKQ